MENLTKHEEHMCEILVRKMRGEAVEMMSHSGWKLADKSIMLVNAEYRKPIKKIIMPWDLINDEWVAFAVDKDGTHNLYSHGEIKAYDTHWAGVGAGVAADYCRYPLKIDTDGIGWKDTLTLRPEK